MQDDAKGTEPIELKQWSCGTRTEQTFIIMFKTVKDVPSQGGHKCAKKINVNERKR